MPGLLGKKLGMTSIFTAQGKSIPCTVLEVGPCHVLQLRTKETDGYTALQLGYEGRSEKNVNKMIAFCKANVGAKTDVLREKWKRVNR